MLRLALGGLAAAAFAGASLAFYRRWAAATARTLPSLHDFYSFEPHEVLAQGEGAVILGRFAWQHEGELALIKMARKGISTPIKLLHALSLALSSYSGEEYCYYDGSITPLCALHHPALLSLFAVEVIAPASKKQIARARPQPAVLITETPQAYEAVTLPYIEGLDPKAIGWVYNLLALKKERERMLFNDPDPENGFLLNIDTKWKSHPDCHMVDEKARAAGIWNGHPSVVDLYCLAICHRQDIRCLRDLTAEHLPMLKRILERGTASIEAIYGVPANELRVFVHYMPQFFHFHVHFTRLHNDLGCQVERAHLLQDIIDTLEADGRAYSKKTLHYQLKVNDPLFAAYQGNSMFRMAAPQINS